MLVYSVLLACQSMAPLQNFAHIPREGVSLGHYFDVPIESGTHLFGACFAPGVQENRWLLGDDFLMFFFFTFALHPTVTFSVSEEYKKLILVLRSCVSLYRVGEFHTFST